MKVLQSYGLTTREKKIELFYSVVGQVFSEKRLGHSTKPDRLLVVHMQVIISHLN